MSLTILKFNLELKELSLSKIDKKMVESIFTVCWLSLLHLVCSHQDFEAHTFLPAQVNISHCIKGIKTVYWRLATVGSQTVAPSNYIAFLWQVNLALWEAKKAVSVEQDAVRSCFCQNCHRYPKNERQIDKRNCFPTKRCAWRCMDLEEDGGTCNAILYDRESKVMENDRNWCWYDNEHNQGLPNGWGKACRSSNTRHWSKGRLEQVIFSTNSVDIGNRKCKKHFNSPALPTATLPVITTSVPGSLSTGR